MCLRSTTVQGERVPDCLPCACSAADVVQEFLRAQHLIKVGIRNAIVELCQILFCDEIALRDTHGVLECDVRGRVQRVTTIEVSNYFDAIVFEEELAAERLRGDFANELYRRLLAELTIHPRPVSKICRKRAKGKIREAKRDRTLTASRRIPILMTH